MICKYIFYIITCSSSVKEFKDGKKIALLFILLKYVFRPVSAICPLYLHLTQILYIRKACLISPIALPSPTCMDSNSQASLLSWPLLGILCPLSIQLDNPMLGNVLVSPVLKSWILNWSNPLSGRKNEKKKNLMENLGTLQKLVN